MTVELIQQLATQTTHLDIIETQLLDALEQLKKLRQEHEEIMQNIIKENKSL